jgi:ligand-binding sensor domain-containing protein
MVQAILQDRQGHMWFGTCNNGVSRYDGEHWIGYDFEDGLPSNDVRAMYEDRDGRLWLAMAGGIASIGPEGVTGYGPEDGLPKGDVVDIAEDGSGNLWFAVHGTGVVRREGDQWITLDDDVGLRTGGITGLTFASDGALWVSTYTSIERYDGTSWTVWDESENLPEMPVFSVGADRSGDVWATFRHGVARYDGEAWTTFGPDVAPDFDMVVDVYEDVTGDHYAHECHFPTTLYIATKCPWSKRHGVLAPNARRPGAGRVRVRKQLTRRPTPAAARGGSEDRGCGHRPGVHP